MGLLPSIGESSPMRTPQRGQTLENDSSSEEDEASTTRGGSPMRGLTGGGGDGDGFEFQSRAATGQRRRKKVTKERQMHKRLLEACAAKDTESMIGHYYATPALIGERAEEAYKQKRIVSNSRVMQAAQRESPVRPREVITFSDGGTHVVRQLCLLKPCNLMDNKQHMARFFHECRLGALCPNRRDHAHAQQYTHPDPEDQEALSQLTPWQREDYKSPQCVPTLSAQRFQNHHQPFAYAPRGKFRPQGGMPMAPDLVEEARRNREIRRDTVSVVFQGIDLRCDDDDLRKLVRDAVGAVPLISVQVTTEGGKRTGGGVVEVGCHADAEVVVKCMDGRALEGFVNTLKVTYNDPVVDEVKDVRPSLVGGRGWGLAIAQGVMVDPGVRRFSRAIRSCGAYYQDAEAIMQRMRREGHTPDDACIVHLMRSYAEADPPQPARAEGALLKLRDEGLKVTTSACNYVVKAWCKSGNMGRAEALVKEMETEKWPVNPIIHWRGKYLPIPNEDTYHVLAESWERLGVMEEIAERQGGLGLDEEKCTKSVGGVVGSNQPAGSYVASWARRRSGYMGMHSGHIVSRVDRTMNMGTYYAPRKWRERC